jgi:hypothetical protein
MNKVKESAMKFRDSIGTYFKEQNVEIKDWKFTVESSESNYLIDVSVKVLIKPKTKASK